MGLVGVGMPSHAQAMSSLTVLLESVKTEYVIGEPVKFRVTLRNTGNETLRVVCISDLEANSDYLYYEVEHDGQRDHCVTRFIDKHVMFDPVYEGEPLRPSEEVATLLYPGRVWRRPAGQRSRWVGLRDMFPAPGSYRVSVTYVVSADHLKLWSTGQTGQKSDDIELVFREPDSVERRILAACSPGSDLAAHLGELNAHAQFDEAALRAILSEFPDHPMSDYARLCLARSLTRIGFSGIGPSGREGVAIFEELRARVPNFRAEEVAKQLATAYYYLNERELAVSIFEDALKKYPYMGQQYSFMNRYIHALTGDGDAPRRWNESRRQGKRGLEFLQE